LQEANNDILEYRNLSELEIDINTASILLLMFIIVSGCYRYWYTIFSVRYIHNIGTTVANRIHKNIYILLHDQSENTDLNEVKTALTVKIDNFVGQFLLPIVSMIQSLVSVILISLALAYINIYVFILSFSVLSFVSIALILSKKHRIEIISGEMVQSRQRINHIVNDSISNYESLAVNSYSDYFHSAFRSVNSKIRALQAETQILALTPKYLLEVCIFGLITLAIIFLNNAGNGFLEALPTAIAFVFAAQKLLPCVNLIYFSFTQIRANMGVATSILKLINSNSSIQKNTKRKNTQISNTNETPFIRVKQMTWSLGKNRQSQVLNYNFRMGKTYRVTGPSGVGKSSLIKALMGLNRIYSGNLIVQGQDFTSLNIEDLWKHFTYVAQNDVIFEASILENVALKENCTEKEITEITRVLSLVGLNETMLQNKLKLTSTLDSASSELSGGQRQRLIIARALFNAREVIVFDEATSALDENSESVLLEDIIKKYQDNKIIIYISHKSNNPSCSVEEVTIR
jgi:ABC-type multidrug transport system fused ATPase/permease subunit